MSDSHYPAYPMFDEWRKPYRHEKIVNRTTSLQKNEIQIDSTWRMTVPKEASEQVLIAAHDLQDFFKPALFLDLPVEAVSWAGVVTCQSVELCA